MRKTRVNYWSESKLSKYLRKKYDITSPYALGWDEWNKFYDDCKNKAPVIHWLTHKGFDKAQDVVLFVPDLYYTIKHATIWKYFRNLKLFHKALWRHRSWDYTGLLEFMIIASNDMQKAHENDTLHKYSEKRAKDLKVFTALLERVAKDEYTDDKIVYGRGKGLGNFKQIPGTLPSYKAKSFYKLTSKQRENDLKLASKILSTKLFSWWC